MHSGHTYPLPLSTPPPSPQNRCCITAGTWVLYTNPNYNDKEGGTEDTFKIVKHGVKDVDITSVNGSMFLIDGGIVLFEHFLYGGERKVLRI